MPERMERSLRMTYPNEAPREWNAETPSSPVWVKRRKGRWGRGVGGVIPRLHSRVRYSNPSEQGVPSKSHFMFFIDIPLMLVLADRKRELLDTRSSIVKGEGSGGFAHISIQTAFIHRRRFGRSSCSEGSLVEISTSVEMGGL